MMKHKYPNFFKLVDSLLVSGSDTSVTVLADLDANSYEEVPLITWRVLNRGQAAYGLWEATLLVNVLCETFDMDELLTGTYSLIHSWDTPGMGVLTSENIGVESVTDGGVFDLVNQAILNGKHILQFSGQFDLTIKDWS